MPVPANVVTRVNALLATLATVMATRQALYFSNHSKYFQGLRTMVITPADGATAAPVLSSHPTDQAASWGDLNVNLPAQMEVCLTCDAYEAPGNGHGYVLGVEVVYGGELWRRTQNFVGPAVERSTPWTNVTPAPDAP